MIFETLKIRNLASLKGNHEIDLRNLNKEGLFIISGPTGSGKSTILNAISLALYGKTYKKDLFASDYVTQGELSGEVELIFTYKEKKYFAWWECKRSKKNGEPLKKPITRRNLYSKKSDQEEYEPVEYEIDEILNLNHDQFIKTVILNQGEFARFLSSSFAERRTILENLNNENFLKLLSPTLSKNLKHIESEIKEDQDTLIQLKEELKKQKDNLRDVDYLKKEKLKLIKKEEDTNNKIKVTTDFLNILESKEHILQGITAKKEEIKNASETIIEQNNKVNISQNKLIEETQELEILKPTLLEGIKIIETKNNLNKTLNTHRQQRDSAQIEKLQIKRRLEDLKIELKKNSMLLKSINPEWSKTEIQERTEDTYSKINKAKNIVKELGKIEVEFSSKEFQKGLDSSKQLIEVIEKINSNKKEISMQQSAIEAKKERQKNLSINNEILKELSLKQNENNNNLRRLAEVEDLKISQTLILNTINDLKNFQNQKGKLSNLHDYINKEFLDFVASKFLLKKEEETSKIIKQKISQLLETNHVDSIDNSLKMKQSLDCQIELDIDKLQNTIEKSQELQLIENSLNHIKSNTENKINHVINFLSKFLSDNHELKGVSTLNKFKPLLNAIRDIKTLQENVITEESSKLINFKETLKAIDQKQKVESKITLILKEEEILNKNFTKINIEFSNLEEELKKIIFNIQELERKIHELEIPDNPILLLKQKENQIKDLTKNLEILKDAKRSEEIKRDQSKGQLDQLQHNLKNTDFLINKIKNVFGELFSNNPSGQFKSELGNQIQYLGQLLLDLRDQHDSFREEISVFNHEIGKNEEKSNYIDKLKLKILSIEKSSKSRIKEKEDLEFLYLVIGKDEFRNYVLKNLEEVLIQFTNNELKNLYESRFQLVHGGKKDKEFYIIDNFNFGEKRKVSTLSGGETFIVSLCLALGLSEATSQNGEFKSFFIDEGFGTLDKDSLEEVIQALTRLKERGKVIGLISHVEELKEAIPAKLQLRKDLFGVSHLSRVL